jgi:hypothetical protein
MQKGADDSVGPFAVEMRLLVIVKNYFLCYLKN